jgi:hypothetical protein
MDNSSELKVLKPRPLMTSVEKDAKILLGMPVISTMNAFDQRLKSRTPSRTCDHLKRRSRKPALLSLRRARMMERSRSLIHLARMGSSANSCQRSLINHGKHLRHVPGRTQRTIKLQRNVMLPATRYMYFHVDAPNEPWMWPNP